MSGRSPDVGDTSVMRMYFELLRDAAGQTNQPYERNVRDLNTPASGMLPVFGGKPVAQALKGLIPKRFMGGD
jgi:hypothetical protein